ncbi:MAG: fructose-6-phosphate aldolase [Firmicutes bacterium]|nr:fructose-6-phosphate aldolase [Bacillota bacterium]HQD39423.1 fructose-6-phosphate aldolase [Bacillota bacterium]
MKIYLDSASVEEVRRAASWGLLSGVTTNPTLIAKEGRDFHQVIREICGLVKGPVSAEVTGTTASQMVEEARELAKISGQVVIKIPITTEGLEAVHKLKREGIHTNVTLIFSANQALLAARAGASYVSPFLGRLDDISHDGISVVGEIAEIFQKHRIETQIIAASLRHPRHFTEAALAGAHIATVPMAVLEKLIVHPLTDQGIERFLADWKKMQS